MPGAATRPLFDEARKLGIAFYLGYAELTEEAGEIKHVYDVRGPDERDRGFIEGSIHLDRDAVDHIKALPKDTPIAFYCAGGVRSQAAADSFLQEGFTKVFNLSGGLTAWAAHVDPSVLG